jgi:hypothetical protein
VASGNTQETRFNMPNDKKTPMTPDAAARIQGHADRTKTNEGFKERAQRGAAQNVDQGKVPPKGKK